MTRFKKFIFSVILCFSILLPSVPAHTVSALSLSSFPFILLSQYDATMNIGAEIFIVAITTNEKQATWKSSDSKIAAVNTYGVITAKKAGTAIITAKITDAEASCFVTVSKTKITLSKTNASIERGETLKLSATTSNDSSVTWKSSKKSVAVIDEYGRVTGMKPGETAITATADGSTAVCTLSVKSPNVQLSKTSLSLYRGQTFKLSATVSSGINPTWKTNKKSVATVDAEGSVTAVKNGTAIITATVDGVSKTCEITVQKPEITLSSSEITLKKGEKVTLKASVSSNNLPVWSTSNTNVVSVDSSGVITALTKGKAYVYAAEDGAKVRCTVNVTD